MADFHPSVAREIDVGHADLQCGLVGHGHRLRVEVTVRGTYDAQRGTSSDVADLEAALDGILAEVHLKPLDVISPARATFEGFGLWILERLLPGFPKIVEVQVWRDPLTRFSIKREPR